MEISRTNSHNIKCLIAEQAKYATSSKTARETIDKNSVANLSKTSSTCTIETQLRSTYIDNATAHHVTDISNKVTNILHVWSPRGLLSPFARLPHGAEVPEENGPPELKFINGLMSLMHLRNHDGKLTQSAKKRITAEKKTFPSLIQKEHDTLIAKFNGMEIVIINHEKAYKLANRKSETLLNKKIMIVEKLPYSENDKAEKIKQYRKENMDEVKQRIAAFDQMVAHLCDHFFDAADKMGDEILRHSHKLAKWPPSEKKEFCGKLLIDALSEIINLKAHVVDRDTASLAEIASVGAKEIDDAKLAGKSSQDVHLMESNYRAMLLTIMPDALPRASRHHSAVLESLMLHDITPGLLQEDIIKMRFYHLPTYLNNVRSAVQRQFSTIQLQGINDLKNVQYWGSEFKREIVSRAEKISKQLIVDVRSNRNNNNNTVPWNEQILQEMNAIYNVSEPCCLGIFHAIVNDFLEKTEASHPDIRIQRHAHFIQQAEKLDAVAEAWEELQAHFAETLSTLLLNEVDKPSEHPFKKLQSEMAHQQRHAETFAFVARSYAKHFLTLPLNVDHKTSQAPSKLPQQIDALEEQLNAVYATPKFSAPTASSIKNTVIANEELAKTRTNARDKAIAARNLAQSLMKKAAQHMNEFRSEMKSSLTRNGMLEQALSDYQNAINTFDVAIESMGSMHDLGSISTSELEQQRKACYAKWELINTYANSPKCQRPTEQTLNAIDKEGGLIIRSPQDAPYLVTLDRGDDSPDHFIEGVVEFSEVKSSFSGQTFKPPQRFYLHVHLSSEVDVTRHDVISQLHPEQVLAAHVKPWPFRFRGRRYEQRTGTIVPRGVLSAEFGAMLARRTVQAAQSQ